jgi:hypothetical protein
MVAVKSTPLGPPMGGPLGPPPGAPVQMPNTGGPPPMMQPGMAPPPPMGMAPPPMGGVPQAAQASAPLSTQVSGYGGSASGRAKFKGALSARKTAFMAKQNTPVPPVAPPSFGQFAGGPIAGAPMGGAPMGPVPPMVGPPNTMMAGVGRTLGDNANVGSAPVQLMNGGVVPLFGGLGQY